MHVFATGVGLAVLAKGRCNAIEGDKASNGHRGNVELNSRCRLGQRQLFINNLFNCGQVSIASTVPGDAHAIRTGEDGTLKGKVMRRRIAGAGKAEAIALFYLAESYLKYLLEELPCSIVQTAALRH